VLSHVLRHPPTSILFPYTTLFRSLDASGHARAIDGRRLGYRRRRVVEADLRDVLDRVARRHVLVREQVPDGEWPLAQRLDARQRSEEHTSELQSRENLVCRLLLEK